MNDRNVCCVLRFKDEINWVPPVQRGSKPARSLFQPGRPYSFNPHPSEINRIIPPDGRGCTSQVSRHHANGVTLIEVMVSLIILTMGLLGMATLHGLGTKTNNQSYFRTQAVNQAYDILDRMRANRAGTSGGYYALPSSSVTVTGNCTQSPCSISDTAKFDLSEWNRANLSLLPSGSGTVSIEGSSVSVEINWIENTGRDGESESKSVTALVRL